MNSITWYDLITLTNPKVALIFGFVFSFLLPFIIFKESKEKRSSFVFPSVGLSISVLLVSLLKTVGFY